MANGTLLEPRDRILAAACEVFATKGFKDATVRAICDLAGVNLAAINYYFGDKERLYIESIKQAHRQRGERFPLPQWAEPTPPRDKLRSFVSNLLHRMLDDSGDAYHMQLMMREMLQPTAACAELVRDFIRPHFELLLSLLDEIVPVETTLARRKLIALSIVGQCLHHRITRPVIQFLFTPDEFARLSIETLAEHITQLTLDGIATRSEVGP